MDFTPIIRVKDPEYWVRELNKGNSHAMTSFFNLYYAEICHYIFQIVENDELAEEIADDCFLKLWQTHGVNTYANAGGVRAFLYTVAKNRSIDEVRKSESTANKLRGFEERYVVEDNKNEKELQHYESLWNELITELYTAIDELGAQQRSVILLFQKSHTTEEISEILNLPAQIVLNYKNRALQILRRKLTPISFAFLVFCIGSELDGTKHEPPISSPRKGQILEGANFQK